MCDKGKLRIKEGCLYENFNLNFFVEIYGMLFGFEFFDFFLLLFYEFGLVCLVGSFWLF